MNIPLEVLVPVVLAVIAGYGWLAKSVRSKDKELAKVRGKLDACYLDRMNEWKERAEAVEGLLEEMGHGE